MKPVEPVFKSSLEKSVPSKFTAIWIKGREAKSVGPIVELSSLTNLVKLLQNKSETEQI